jgi:hypothetical protein
MGYPFCEKILCLRAVDYSYRRLAKELYRWVYGPRLGGHFPASLTRAEIAM